jgi:hypothetical protein
VENISGASVTIGTAQVVRAAPDGYNILWATVGETIVYRFMSKNQVYDSVKELTPLTAAVSGITLFAAHPSTPCNNLKEVIDYARANPGKLRSIFQTRFIELNIFQELPCCLPFRYPRFHRPCCICRVSNLRLARSRCCQPSSHIWV